MEKSTAYWADEIPARARRWAQEAAAVTEAREGRVMAARTARAAEWPVERIRAIAAEWRAENGVA